MFVIDDDDGRQLSSTTLLLQVVVFEVEDIGEENTRKNQIKWLTMNITHSKLNNKQQENFN